MYEISSLKELKEYLRADLRPKVPGESCGLLKGYLRFPTYRLVVWLRVCQYLKRKRNPLYPLAYLFLNHYKVKYGIDAHVSTPIGPGLDIVHGGAVFLSVERIGANCTIYQGVTLGSGLDYTSGYPVMEDNVVLYTGAVISGPVTLHKGCRVGANSVVTRDVPENTLVGGAPARVIRSL